MILLDKFLEEGSQSIFRLFSIQALCTTCQVSLNVENGDFSQMLLHVRLFHRLMLSPQKDEDIYCEDSYNFNPPSPSVSKSKIHQANCDGIKSNTQVKEESAHASLVSIKILKKKEKTRKNKVWEHFTAIDEKRTEFQCKLCSCLVTADKNRKVRKFYKHLSEFHKPVYEEYRHDREFVCSYCGKNFVSSDGLKYHIAAHTEIRDKQFNCTTCNKGFLTKGLLNRHELVHSGEKSFICQECGKRFSQRSHLTNHTKLHTGETPFNCDKCGKNFRMKHHLSLHQCKT